MKNYLLLELFITENIIYYYDIERTKAAYGFMSNYLGVDHPDSNTLNFNSTIVAKKDSNDTAQPNVVLVICESFSGYKSSMYGNPLNTTPYFNNLCNNGIFFDHYFTPTYGTARGVWATITGRCAPRHRSAGENRS